MKRPSLSAPIASPHGAGEIPTPVSDEQSAHLVVSYSLGAVCRYAVLEWVSPFIVSVLLVSPPLVALAAFPLMQSRYGLLALPLVALIFLGIVIGLAAPLAFVARLCLGRLFLVEISSAGLTQAYQSHSIFHPKRDITFPWRKFIWIIERDGDLWMASFITGCFVPREAFASRAEAREFAAFVRALKEHNGTNWRREWNGRVFGIHPFGQITRVAE